MRRLSIISVLLMWFFATGSCWDLVQTFAWGRMIATYSQTMPLTQAVRLTFTPDNLCALCETVSKAERRHEGAPIPGEAGQPGKLLLVFKPAVTCVAAIPSVAGALPDGPADMRSVARAAPPVPPPRGRV